MTAAGGENLFEPLTFGKVAGKRYIRPLDQHLGAVYVPLELRRRSGSASR